MERLQGIFQAIVEGFGRLVDRTAPLIQSLGSAVDIQFGPGAASVTAGLFWIAVIIFILQRGAWGNWAMFRPQAVVHLTSRTPFQVVMADLTGCLIGVVLLLAVLVVLAMLGGMRAGTTGP